MHEPPGGAQPTSKKLFSDVSVGLLFACPGLFGMGVHAESEHSTDPCPGCGEAGEEGGEALGISWGFLGHFRARVRA